MSRTRCVISEKSKFIVLLIAKNASSTLRHEFRRPEYESRELLVKELNKEQMAYPIYAFLRDPYDRFLSGYHEVYSRHLGQIAYIKKNNLNDIPSKNFLSQTDDINTIEEFLNHIEERGFFDVHIKTQSDYLGNLTIAEYFNVENLDSGINRIRVKYNLPQHQILLQKHRKRRRSRKIQFDYKKIDLPFSLLEKIKNTYAEDLRLYNSLFKEFY